MGDGLVDGGKGKGLVVLRTWGMTPTGRSGLAVKFEDGEGKLSAWLAKRMERIAGKGRVSGVGVRVSGGEEKSTE